MARAERTAQDTGRGPGTDPGSGLVGGAKPMTQIAGTSIAGLLAVKLDWLEGLLPLLFVLVWVVSQALGMFRKVAGKGPADRVRPAERPPAGGGFEPRQPADVEAEIEEFLRRTLGGEPVPRPVGRPPKTRSRVQRPRRAEPVPTGPLPMTGGAGEPSAARGGSIAEHVAAAFAHDLAHEMPLIPEPAAARPLAGPPAAELFAALRSPETLRSLLLAREILERPVHRW